MKAFLISLLSHVLKLFSSLYRSKLVKKKDKIQIKIDTNSDGNPEVEINIPHASGEKQEVQNGKIN